jgi:hypothetical protein
VLTTLLWLIVALIMLLGAGEEDGALPQCARQQLLALLQPCRCRWMLPALLPAVVEARLASENLRAPPLAPAGLMRGAYVGATDSCKYTETFVLDTSSRKISNPRDREQVGASFFLPTLPPCCDGHFPLLRAIL